jgi:hypothetical protein
MSKKSKGFKSRGLSHDSLSVQFIESPTEIIRIGAWDAYITLTPTEVVRLSEWLKKATPYIKKKYNLKS